jgi:hypothetical protein
MLTLFGHHLKKESLIALLAQTLKQTADHDQLVYFQKAGLASLSQKGVMNLFVFIGVLIRCRASRVFCSK